MRTIARRFAAPAALLVVISATVAAVAPDDSHFPHERKEVAGLAVVFGAEPEPAITDEVQFLRWRVSTLEDEKPYSDFTDAAEGPEVHSVDFAFNINDRSTMEIPARRGGR